MVISRLERWTRSWYTWNKPRKPVWPQKRFRSSSYRLHVDTFRFRRSEGRAGSEKLCSETSDASRSRIKSKRRQNQLQSNWVFSGIPMMILSDLWSMALPPSPSCSFFSIENDTSQTSNWSWLVRSRFQVVFGFLRPPIFPTNFC